MQKLAEQTLYDVYTLGNTFTTAELDLRAWPVSPATLPICARIADLMARRCSRNPGNDRNATKFTNKGAKEVARLARATAGAAWST